jgi:hypothetical protein
MEGAEVTEGRPPVEGDQLVGELASPYLAQPGEEHRLGGDIQIR